MEKALEGVKEEVDGLSSHSACYEERISQLEESMTDVLSKITALNAAVERTVANLLPKVESLITERRSASAVSSDEAASGTGVSAVPSTSKSEAPFVSIQQDTLVTELEAAAVGDAVVLHRMFANPNARDSHGVPALHLAVSGGHVKAVEAFLEGGAHVDIEGPGLQTALHVAAAKGHVDVVRVLLDAKAKMETKDLEGNTPLMIAAKNKQGNILRYLVAAGANVNYECAGEKPLILAVKNADLDSVNCLIRAGSDVNSKNNDGITALTLAVEGKQWALARLLVENGADSNALVLEDSSALMVTVAEGDIQTVTVMLRHNAPDDVFKALSYAENASMVWAFENVLPGVIRENGGKAMIQAATKGRLHSMEALLDAGVDINSQNHYGSTALMCASHYGHGECVKELLRRGALLDECNNSGLTALHYAAGCGNDDIVRMLLAAGADATIRDKEGKTSLDEACAEATKNIFKNHPTQ